MTVEVVREAGEWLCFAVALYWVGKIVYSHFRGDA